MNTTQMNDPLHDGINSTIKRLIFSNPSLDFKMSRKIISDLQTYSVAEKEKIRSWLEDNLKVFKTRSTSFKKGALQKDTLEKVKKHIDQWENEFGKVNLEELSWLTETTGIHLTDIGWERGAISPASITLLLDKYMVGQEEYKRELGLTFYTHLLKVKNPDLNIPKANLLVFGPSGVGKTSGIKILADILKVNQGTINFERLVAEGIQGATISDPFTRTLGKDKEDMILIGDEVDKISKEEIRNELLSILDDNNVISFPTTFEAFREYREVSSKNITCILCGKFDALRKVVEKRIDVHRIGFDTNKERVLSAEDLYAQVCMNDIKQVLGSDEICGRIGNFVSVGQLSCNDFINIMLHKKDSIFNRYQNFFSSFQINTQLTIDGANEIASIAHSKYKDLGVRGLDIIIRQVLKKDMLQADILQGKDIMIDKNYVNNNIVDITNI